MSTETKKVIVYACGVDFQHEMDSCITSVYPTPDSIRHARTCWEQCGIVELEVSFVSWVRKQDFFNKISSKGRTNGKNRKNPKVPNKSPKKGL